MKYTNLIKFMTVFEYLKSFVSIVENFLANHNAPERVQNMLRNFHTLGTCICKYQVRLSPQSFRYIFRNRESGSI